MEDIVIRRVEMTEVQMLQQVGRQSFDETFSPHNQRKHMDAYLSATFTEDKLKRELEDNRSQFFFALVNGVVAGYLKINTGEAQTELADDKGMEIERIYVLQCYQGKKIGYALFQQALKIARQLKMKYIWLGVWEHNAKAINFYKKSGFVQFEKHIFKLGPISQTDLMMKLEL